MSPQECLDLNIKTFWLMQNQIPKIQAMKDLRHLDLLVAAQSSEQHSKKIRSLVSEGGGDPSKDVSQLDRAGLNELRNIAI